MSLQTQLNSFVLRVAEEFNTVKGRTGTLTALTTRSPPSCSTVPLKLRNTESYFSRYTM